MAFWANPSQIFKTFFATKCVKRWEFWKIPRKLVTFFGNFFLKNVPKKVKFYPLFAKIIRCTKKNLRKFYFFACKISIFLSNSTHLWFITENSIFLAKFQFFLLLAPIFGFAGNHSNFSNFCNFLAISWQNYRSFDEREEERKKKQSLTNKQTNKEKF